MTEYEVEVTYKATMTIEAESRDEAEDVGCENFWSDGLNNAELERIDVEEVGRKF